MNIRENATMATAVILLLCVFSFWVGLRAGIIPCNHTCYWCGKSLEAK